MYKLSPSDFAYLYEDCKLCYYLKVKEGIMPPPGIFPGVFSTMNAMLQGEMVGKNLREFGRNLPDMEIIHQEGFVASKPIPNTQVYISGKYDLLCKNPDGTFTIIDLKISKPAEEKIDKYKTQLGAYKFALENSNTNDNFKITRLALLIFYPEKVQFDANGAVIDFPAKWMEIPIDDQSFFNFIGKINDLLQGEPPFESEACGLCKYRHDGESVAHLCHAPEIQAEEAPF